MNVSNLMGFLVGIATYHNASMLYSIYESGPLLHVVIYSILLLAGLMSVAILSFCSDKTLNKPLFGEQSHS
jgi:hypothetical protein